jgi:hypothetical protein
VSAEIKAWVITYSRFIEVTPEVRDRFERIEMGLDKPGDCVEVSLNYEDARDRAFELMRNLNVMGIQVREVVCRGAKGWEKAGKLVKPITPEEEGT